MFMEFVWGCVWISMVVESVGGRIMGGGGLLVSRDIFGGNSKEEIINS